MTGTVTLVSIDDLGPAASLTMVRAHKAVMLDALWRRMGLEPHRTRSRTRAGRPRCAKEGFDLSTSHDRGLVGVALGTARIGLDVMRWRTVPASVSAWLATLPSTGEAPGNAGRDRCVREWTEVEAVIKYLGGSVVQEWLRTAHGKEPSSLGRFVAAGGQIQTWGSPRGAASVAHWKPGRILLRAPPLATPQRRPFSVEHHTAQSVRTAQFRGTSERKEHGYDHR